MAYYVLNPEVLGGMGRDTVMESPTVGSYLPHVKVLHVEISGWMGDDLLTNFPCFMGSGLMLTVHVVFMQK